MRTLRVVVGFVVLGLAGCVAPPPPPVMVAPGQAYMGTYCSAGAYQCGLPQAGAVGAPCACPGLGAPSYGVVR